MKGQLFCFALFLARIVAAGEIIHAELGTEIVSAVLGPDIVSAELGPEFLTDCKLVVEAESVSQTELVATEVSLPQTQLSGIYVYVQPIKMEEGIPRMALTQKIAVAGKKNYTFDQSSTTRVRIKWWRVQTELALRFSVNGVKSVITVEAAKHFCLRQESETLQYWAIYNQLTERVIGWSTLVDDLTGVTCNPDIGLLSYIRPSEDVDNVPYALPIYKPFIMVYECVTYLKRLELSSGIASGATAASLDIEQSACVYWYQPHSGLQLEKNAFTDIVCFLEEKPGLTATPELGFYQSCLIYTMHPYYPGKFSLSANFKSDHDPTLHADRGTAESNGIFKTNSKSTYELLFDKSTSIFTPSINLDVGFSTEVHAGAHSCIGPDVSRVFYVTDSNPAIANSLMMRADKGLPCTPVEGRWTPSDFTFTGGYLTIDYIETFVECVDVVKAIPNSYWKAYVIDTVTRICIVYGDCLLLSDFRKDDHYENEAYTCVVNDYTPDDSTAIEYNYFGIPDGPMVKCQNAPCYDDSECTGKGSKTVCWDDPQSFAHCVDPAEIHSCDNVLCTYNSVCDKSKNFVCGCLEDEDKQFRSCHKRCTTDYDCRVENLGFCQFDSVCIVGRVRPGSRYDQPEPLF